MRPVEHGLAHAQAGDGGQDVGQALLVDRHALGQCGCCLARRSGSPGSRISAEPGAGGRGLDPVAHGRGLGGDPRPAAQGRGVEDEGQHAVEDAVLALVVRGDGGPAGDRGTQDLGS